MKKLISLLLAIIFLLTLCACGGKEPSPAPEEDLPPDSIYYDITGVDPREIVLTLDSNEVPAELFYYWVSYICSSLEYQIGSAYYYQGLFGELLNTETGEVNWAADYEGRPLSEVAKEDACQAVTFYAAVENLAAQYGLSITEEDEATLAEGRASMVENLGGEEAFQDYLGTIGLSEANYTRINRSAMLYEKLLDLTMDESSDLYLAPEDYEAYAAYADHILLATIDLTTREPLGEEEASAKRALAEDLLARLQAAENQAELFGQLADEYSEDTGRASNPNGYVVTPDSSFVASFKETALALEPGTISGIVESEYGYHILLRRTLWDALEGDTTQRENLADTYLGNTIEERAAGMTAVFREKLDSFDAGEFYKKYTEALAQREAAEEAESPSQDGGAPSQDGEAPSQDGEAPPQDGEAPEGSGDDGQQEEQ